MRRNRGRKWARTMNITTSLRRVRPERSSSTRTGRSLASLVAIIFFHTQVVD